MDHMEAMFAMVEVELDRALMAEAPEDVTLEEIIEAYPEAKDLVLGEVKSGLGKAVIGAMLDYKINTLKASLDILTKK